MAYKVKTEPTPLSKGAVVGIGVGASLAAIAIVAGAAFVCLRWRRQTNRRRAGADHLDSHLGMTYESGYHAPRESGVPLRALERPYSDHREGVDEYQHGHGHEHGYGQRAGDGYYRM